MKKRTGRRIMGLMGVLFFCGTASVWAAVTLENPAPGALKSGVGVISGWVCDAEELEVSFDGGPRTFVPYGSERVDTAGVCGDADNGFGLLWNYNELGDGPHTVTLYADGMIQTQVDFNVVTLGTNFLRSVTGQGTIALSDGKQVNVQWEETTQGFTITGTTDDEEPTDITSTDAETALNRLRGVWRVYYGDPLNNNSELWDFSDWDIRQEAGFHVLRGDFIDPGVGDRIEWVDVRSTSEVYGPKWVAETGYEYVALYEDAFDDEFGDSCIFVFFSFTSTRSFFGRSPSSTLYDDGTCGQVSSLGSLEVTGVRIEQ